MNLTGFSTQLSDGIFRFMYFRHFSSQSHVLSFSECLNLMPGVLVAESERRDDKNKDIKRHIRAKLDPPKSNNNTTKPLRPREPQSEKQRTSQKGNKEPRDYRPPQTQQSNRGTRRTERTWYNQRDRQPRYRQQQEGRRQQPQGRYYLTRGQFSRNRYKN